VRRYTAWLPGRRADSGNTAIWQALLTSFLLPSLQTARRKTASALYCTLWWRRSLLAANMALPLGWAEGGHAVGAAKAGWDGNDGFTGWRWTVDAETGISSCGIACLYGEAAVLLLCSSAWLWGAHALFSTSHHTWDSALQTAGKTSSAGLTVYVKSCPFAGFERRHGRAGCPNWASPVIPGGGFSLSSAFLPGWRGVSHGRRRIPRNGTCRIFSATAFYLGYCIQYLCQLPLTFLRHGKSASSALVAPSASTTA